MHRLRPVLHRVLGRSAPVHPRRWGHETGRSGSGQPRRHRNHSERFGREQLGDSPAPHSSRRRARMRRMQSVLAGVPGFQLHHNGAGGPGPSGAHLGPNDRRCIVSTTLIQNGTIVAAERTYEADILIEDERIKDVAPGLPAESVDKRIDARGMYVMPGGIDVHTRLDMPFGGTTSSDDFETGTRAAAFGGTTTLVDFAIQPEGT